jgi:hypothetical protein
MDSKQLTSHFCSILKDFLEDIYKSYPDNSLLMLKQATSAMILTHPNGVVDNFMLCVEPYIEKILKKDQSFFLDGNLENDLSSGEYSFLLDELKKISKIWQDTSTPERTKQSIWKYLQVLVKLGNNLKK